MYKILFSIVFSLFFHFLAGQNPDFIHFTKTDIIRGIAVRDSFIWAATTGGLVEHNLSSGLTSVITRANSNLPINEIYSVAISPDGRLWLGTQIGLLRQNLSGGWDWLPGPSIQDPKDGYLICSQVVSDGGTGAWIKSTWGNIWHFDGQNWHGFDEEQLFGIGISTTISGCPDGTLWVKVGDEFFKFDGTTAVNWGFTPYLPPVPGASPISDWTVDPQGQLWFIIGSQLGIPDGNGSWKLEEMPLWASHICFNAAGECWLYDDFFNTLFKRDAAGIYEGFENLEEITLSFTDSRLIADGTGMPLVIGENMYRFNGEKFKNISTGSAGIPNNNVVSFALAGEQTIWANFDDYGTNLWDNLIGNDLAVFYDKKWTTVSNQNLDGVNIWNVRDMAVDLQNNIWAAGRELYHHDGAAWKSFEGKDLPFEQFYSVAANPADGSIWVGAYGHIAQLEADGTFTLVPVPGCEYLQVTELEIDYDGIIWLYAYQNDTTGIMRYDGTTWKFYSLEDVGLEDYYFVSDVAIGPDGRVWVVAEWGVSYFDGSEWKLLTEGWPVIGHYSAIAFDGPDIIWLGTFLENCFGPSVNLGLFRAEYNQFDGIYYYKDYPFPYPNTTALVVDGKHNLWIGSQHGGIAVMRQDGVILPVNDPENAKEAVQVFPNPSSGTLNLQFSGIAGIEYQFALLSADGRTVFQQRWTGTGEVQQQAIEIPTGWTAGNYFWHLHGQGALHSGVIQLAK